MLPCTYKDLYDQIGIGKPALLIADGYEEEIIFVTSSSFVARFIGREDHSYCIGAMSYPINCREVVLLDDDGGGTYYPMINDSCHCKFIGMGHEPNCAYIAAKAAGKD